ncbi:MAG: hypothetical protein ACD_80C00092G0001 [uncultured bacterium (gcode 4)]|uniref:Uncharacterized protein n=1 Tax=uncultured bacterium (gcode 4) TaxID=1234023 RepID=K1XJ86_9BACT|nr:MAG: hypothetical protein ACD_80C00092G0001 [uncultured bacterium (gcode 4)]
MKIYSWKEIIEKTNEDIPELITIIKTKEQEITNLLIQENIKDTLQLKWNAYEQFHKTRKEILGTLNILEQLWYASKELNMRKIFKTWPFFTFNKVDYGSPKITIEVKKLKKEQKEIAKSGEVDREKLKKFIINI